MVLAELPVQLIIAVVAINMIVAPLTVQLIVAIAPSQYVVAKNEVNVI